MLYSLPQLENRYLFLLLFCLFSVPLWAQKPEPFFRQYTTEQGLPSNHVYRIHKDKRGYLWFATDNGISRFDGHHFVHYTQANGFTDFGAYHILEDKRGRIWFLTFSGRVCYFENGSFHNIDSTYAGHQHIKWIMEDDKGELFFTTRSFLVTKMNSLVDSMPENIIGYHGLVIEKYIYTISQDKLYIYDRSTHEWTSRTINLSPSFSRIWKLSDGRVIVVDNEYIYELRDKTLYPLQAVRKGKNIEGYVICLYESKEKDIWLGTSNGIYHYKGNHFREPPTLYKPEANVLSITQDHENNFWISTAGQGVFKLSKISGEYYSTREGLSAIPVSAIQVLDKKILVMHPFSSTIDWIDSTGKVTHIKLPVPASSLHNISLIPANKQQVLMQSFDQQVLIGISGAKKLPNPEYCMITRKRRENVLLAWALEFQKTNIVSEVSTDKQLIKRLAEMPLSYELNHIRILDVWVDETNAVWLCSEHNLFSCPARPCYCYPAYHPEK